MSSTILASGRTSLDQFEDVARYVSRTPVPEVPWLTRIHLDEPRRNIRCLSPGVRFAKRAVDVVGSLLLLLLLWPVMLLVAALVRISSPGPIIYRQVRVGLNLRSGDRRSCTTRPGGANAERRAREERRTQHAYGRHFVLYKFRTMYVDAERHGARFAVEGDPRVTPVGRFLRRTRLDELPQLWNVLKGEMSLVGPRPERPEFIRELSEQIPDYLQRLGLKPGLTGVAQIVNGYDNDLEGFRRKVAFDLLYLQNCCFWNDAKILLRTIGVVISGSGAV